MFGSAYNLFITLLVSVSIRTSLYVLGNLENGEYYNFEIIFDFFVVFLLLFYVLSIHITSCL